MALEAFFDSFEVWAIEDKKLDLTEESESVKAERAFKDPVIIGCKKVKSPHSSIPTIERYFIASWGDDIPDYTYALNLAMKEFGYETFSLNYYYDMATWQDYSRFVTYEGIHDTGVPPKEEHG